jgi:hypothetical protein
MDTVCKLVSDFNKLANVPANQLDCREALRLLLNYLLRHQSTRQLIESAGQLQLREVFGIFAGVCCGRKHT